MRWQRATGGLENNNIINRILHKTGSQCWEAQKWLSVVGDKQWDQKLAFSSAALKQRVAAFTVQPVRVHHPVRSACLHAYSSSRGKVLDAEGGRGVGGGRKRKRKRCRAHKKQ